MKVLYIATDKFANTSLEVLADLEQVELVGLITQPDRPVGRKRILTPPDIKKKWLELNLQEDKIWQPQRIKNYAQEILEKTNPEIVIVIAYGQMIPSPILDYPKYGVVNLHGSLLPKYRGAIPVESALINGDKTTGVSIIKMTPKLDDGPVFIEKILEIYPDEHALELRTRLGSEGSALWKRFFQNALYSTITPINQDVLQNKYHRDLSYCYSKELNFENGEIQMLEGQIIKPARNIRDLIRGFSASGAAWIKDQNQKPLKIWRAGKIIQYYEKNIPITKRDPAIFEYKNRLYLNFPSEESYLELEEIQKFGKQRQSY